MAAPDSVNLSGLMDDAKCFAFVRQHRWPEGVHCSGCATLCANDNETSSLRKFRLEGAEG